MTRQLSPKHEALVERFIETSQFEDADQVIDEALRLLEEREERRQWLLAEIQIGIDQAERGELIDYTAERREEIKRRALENARLHKPIRDAVKP
jgi:antitoxin ParD1/3/4